MQKLVNLLKTYATVKMILLLWVVTMATFSVMWFFSLPAVEHFAPGKVLFDLSVTGYSHEYAILLLEALSVEGRDAYLHLQLPVDFIFPGFLAVSSALLLTWTFCKGCAPNAKIFYSSFLPFLDGLFDYLENISIVRMIQSYPEVSSTLVITSSTFTQLKVFCTVIAFLFLLVGIFMAIRHHLAIARSQT